MRHASILLLSSLAISGWTADSYPAPTNAPDSRPMLGVEMTPVPLPVQEQEGLTPNQGVLVQSVFANTAAQTMGLQSGDVILEVNGAPISSMTDLRNEVSINQVGDPVEVTVQRQGQDITSTGQFQPWPSNIPYEPIDSNLEQSFRDWQENRLNQARSDLNNMSKRADDLQRQFAQNEAAAQDDSAAAEQSGPAWRFRYGLGSHTPAPSAPTAAEIAASYGVNVADAGSSAPVGWHFDWDMDPTAAATSSPSQSEKP